MAPRRAKQAATEDIAVAADGNVTPPKKSKLANSVTEGLQRPKPKAPVRRTKAAKREETAAADESASPPKRSRLRSRNATTKENVETEGTRRRVIKRQRQRTVKKTGEEIAGQMGEKSPSKPAVAKKAGTKKPAAEKVELQVPEKTGMKKRGGKVATKGDKDVKEKETDRSAPVKRSRRVNKPAEDENQQPIVKQIATRTLRKRKIVEEAVGIIVEGAIEAIKEAVDTKEELVTNKKTRGRAKKAEADTDDAPKVKSKERSKKGPTKPDTKVSPKKSATMKHNIETTVATKNNSKSKDAKDSKKPVSRAKHNSRVKKMDNTRAKEAATPEANIEENDNTIAEMTQTEDKQKKRNTGSGENNGKLEIKRGKKEEQEVIIKEETMDNSITEDEIKDINNLVPQILNVTVTKDVPFIINIGPLQEAGEVESKAEANGGNAELMEDLNLSQSKLLIYETD